MEMLEHPKAELDLMPFARGLSAVFQPIVRVMEGVRTVVAAEALARGPQGSAYAAPTAMYDAARIAGCVESLDRLCIATELAAAARTPASIAIFLNVHPSTLREDYGFPAFLIGTAMRHDIAPARLTLEILEHARVEERQCSQLLAALAVLRGLGVRIAVDDVAGAVDARRAATLEPDYLKLDAALLHDARHNLWTRDVIAAIVEQAAASRSMVIAEAVETERDLTIAATAGIGLMQGFLLGKPRAAGALADAA